MMQCAQKLSREHAAVSQDGSGSSLGVGVAGGRVAGGAAVGGGRVGLGRSAVGAVAGWIAWWVARCAVGRLGRVGV